MKKILALTTILFIATLLLGISFKNNSGKIRYRDYAAAQIPSIQKVSIFDFQCLANPGNPSTGNVRLYCDSGTGNLTCLTSSGASCISGSGSSLAWSGVTAGTNTQAGAFSTAGPWTFSAAGAASASSVNFTGTPFTGGNATTTFPLVYLSQGAAVTGFQTTGTEIGINAPSGWGGYFLDAFLNGGGTSLFHVTSNGTVWSNAQFLTSSGGSFAFLNKSIILSPQDGFISFKNNALTAGAIVTSGNKVFVTSDFTDSTSTSLQLVTGLSWTLPTSSAINMSFHCSLNFDQGSSAVSDSIGVGVTGTAPTNLSANAVVYPSASTLTAGTLTGLASTTPTAVVTFTPSAATTVWNATIDGTIEQPSNATPGVFGIYVATTTGTDNFIVKRGSYCSLF